jgi:hypothetical protein
MAPGDSIVLTLLISNRGAAPLTWSGTASSPAWISLAPSAGTVPPSGSQSVAIGLRAVGADHDVQLGSLTITSNDTATGPVTVAVRVDVLEQEQTLPVPVAGGWNLISVPLRVPDYARSAVYPASISRAFRYTSGTGYTSHDTLAPQAGYWLKFPAPVAPTVSGHPIMADTIPVAGGWNLVGTISTPLHPSAIGSSGAAIQSPFFAFSIYGFTSTDSLRPGHGYWVKMSGPGSLIVPGTSPARAAAGGARRTAGN